MESSLDDLLMKDSGLKPLMAKSYLSEQSRIKIEMLESCPELDDLLDFDAEQAGE